MAESYLDVFLNSKTGRHHGALYVDKPTPSGSSRFMLSKSVTEGSGTAREAAEVANELFAGMAPALDVTAFDETDLSTIEIPEGAIVTLLTPLTPEAKAECPQPVVEIRVAGAGRAVPMGIGPDTLLQLVHIGRLREDSSSGYDPDLHYLYDHYVPEARA